MHITHSQNYIEIINGDEHYVINKTDNEKLYNQVKNLLNDYNNLDYILNVVRKSFDINKITESKPSRALLINIPDVFTIVGDSLYFCKTFELSSTLGGIILSSNKDEQKKIFDVLKELSFLDTLKSIYTELCLEKDIQTIKGEEQITPIEDKNAETFNNLMAYLSKKRGKILTIRQLQKNCPIFKGWKVKNILDYLESNVPHLKINKKDKSISNYEVKA